MRLFIGTVRKFNEDNWSVSFQASGSQGSLTSSVLGNISDNDLPIAICMGAHVTEPLIDTPVLIVQFNENLDEFGWTHLDRTNSVGIYFKENYINIADDGVIDIKTGDNTSYSQITLTKESTGTGISIDSNTDVVINGHLKVTK